MERLVSFGGLFVMLALAWLFSSQRRRINWRIVAVGLALQFGLALLILRTAPGRSVFDWLGGAFVALLDFVDVGAGFVFGTTNDDGRRDTRLLTSFAFGALPIIIFFSALMSVCYHLNLMQPVVRGVAVVMRKTMRLSGAESLAVAANIFLGQVAAPLVVRPYLTTMTQSELMLVMLAGFATIAGGVMAAYVRMGIDAGHLVTASVISAPAAVMIAKIMQPEVDDTQASAGAEIEQATTVNVMDAAASGAVVGLRIALQIAAVIIAFLALIAMCEFIFQWFLSLFGSELTLRGLLGYLFAPLAWTIGIPWADCRVAGELLAVRLIGNEFIAYAELGQLVAADSPISARSETLLTYALCGFANFGSIGVQLGGIGAAAPARGSDLARLGLRAMLGGMLACFMTACVAGVLL